jgi:hypothetical protein
MSAWRTAAGPASTRQSTLRSASTLGTVADESSRESIAFFVNSGVIKPSITYAGVLSGKRHNENGSEGDPGSCFFVQPSSH